MESPRELLYRHIQEGNDTPVDFARRGRIPFEVVHEILNGEYPKDPKSLHFLGKRLKVDLVEWANRLAAGLTKTNEEQARTSLAGKIWSHLIVEGMSIEAAAKKYKSTVRAIYRVLVSGYAGPSLRQGTLLDAIGLAKDDPLRSQKPPVGVDAGLAEYLGQAVKARNQTVEQISISVGMPAAKLRQLVRGNVSPRLLPIYVPAIARELKLNVRELASRIARTYRTISDCTGTLKYLLSRHILEHGIYIDVFAKQCGVSRENLATVYRNGIPIDENMERIAAKLSATKEEIAHAVRVQSNRRIVKSSSYQAGTDRVVSLNELIQRAANAENIDLHEWGQRHGVKRIYLRSIVYDGIPPKREEVRKPLMVALKLDRIEFDRACRKMAESSKPQADSYLRVKPTTGLQEALLRLVRQGQSIRDIAEAIDAHEKTVGDYLRSAEVLRRARPASQERLRAFLGLDAQTFLRMMEPLEADDQVDDDEEMRLLSAYRKLGEMDQYKLREIAGRMLAQRRFDTFAR